MIKKIISNWITWQVVQFVILLCLFDSAASFVENHKEETEINKTYLEEILDSKADKYGTKKSCLYRYEEQGYHEVDGGRIILAPLYVDDNTELFNLILDKLNVRYVPRNSVPENAKLVDK